MGDDSGAEGTAAQLVRAERLASAARRRARWYVGYLVVFGLASLAMAWAFAFVGGLAAVAITVPLWVAFVVVLSLWAGRQQVSIRGYRRLNGVVIAAWSMVWVLLVVLGTTVFADLWLWWFCGGLVMGGIAFTGAGIAYRRSRP